jgi:sugar lactone lactonase YvrE
MSDKTVFSQFDDEASKTLGVPDGLCQDDEYGCWSARWGASKVIRLDQDGNPDMIVEFPTALNVTSCVFGGRSFDPFVYTDESIGSWLTCRSEHG